MGIFLGASLLSMVELMEFLILSLRPRNKLETGDVSSTENGTVTNPSDRNKPVAVIQEQKKMIDVKTGDQEPKETKEPETGLIHLYLCSHGHLTSPRAPDVKHILVRYFAPGLLYTYSDTDDRRKYLYHERLYSYACDSHIR